MEQNFTAAGMRQELRTRLVEALASDRDLSALVHFLRDDLAFHPDNRSIIGSVLREGEFDAWRHLMTGVRWDDPWPVDYDTNEVRAHCRMLLIELERT